MFVERQVLYDYCRVERISEEALHSAGVLRSATISGCPKQTYPISRIYVVVDGSPSPVPLPDWAQFLPQLSLLRLSQNQSISAALIEGVAHSNSPLLARINTQVCPARLARYLREHSL